MDSSSQYLIGIACLLGSWFLWKRWKCQNSGAPPGPVGIPLLGNIFQVTRRPHVKFTSWAKEYGPIFRLKLLHLRVIVLNDHKIAKEILSDAASAGRMVDNPIFKEFTKGNYGVINAEGAVWEEQRRFMLRTLRDFGFAKRGMEDLILDECQAMLHWFGSFEGKPMSGNRIFNAPVLNSLWRIVSGKRCAWEEEKGSPPKVLMIMDEFFNSSQQVTGNGVVLVPALIHVAPKYVGWNRFLAALHEMNVLTQEVIEQHEKSFDGTNVRDFIDAHLSEMRNLGTKDKETAYKHLHAGILDLLLAGSETTSNSLSWALLYLSQHIPVQAKVYEEVARIIGTNSPSLSHRAEMPYTEAVVAEVLRVAPAAATGIPHRMLQDKWYNGYFFPKGTPIFLNIYGIHKDPKVWGDPQNFRPERFLSDGGEKFEKNEALMTFQVGKRACIGATLAKDTIFLFVVSILQRFQILPEETEQKADLESDLGIFYVPKPFKVKMISRK